MATAKPIPIDQAERELASRDLDRSYLVEAAAGTGKTTLLVSRIMTIISSGRAELEQVVAITFTEKAAGELKVRLREEIEKALQDASIPERERYALALEQLDRASISTIHSFASSLLRERPVEAVVDPGFEQLDEMGSDLLFDDVWQQWKENQLREGPPILRRLLALERKLDREIKPIARRLFENRDIALSLKAAESNYNLAAIWNQLAGSVDELTELANNCVDTGDRGYLQIQQFRRLFELGNAGDSQDRECTLFLDLHINKNSGSKQNWVPSDSCTRQKEIFASLKQGIGEACSAIGADIALGILEWLKDFLHAVEAEKQARGVLDFQDLLLKTRDLVCDHRDVRAYFQQKFRYFLVDEFQDTDPLQAE